MAASKLEINFRRLLERCEAMASEIQENKENVSWRLEKVSCSIHQKIVFYCFLLGFEQSYLVGFVTIFSQFLYSIFQYVLTLQRQATELKKSERLVFKCREIRQRLNEQYVNVKYCFSIIRFKQLIQVVFTLMGLYVGSIVFIINILVITIELFY